MTADDATTDRHDKQGGVMGKPRKPVEVALDTYNSEFARKGMEYRDGSQGVGMPYDMPAHLKVFRLMQDTENHRPPAVSSQALKGWTAQMDFMTFGVTLYARIGMDGTLRFIIEDGEGRETVASYEKEK